MIPTDPQDDTAAEMADRPAASMQPDPNRPPEAPAEPEDESDEEWMRRFIEENIHLASPRVVRPPAPPPQPWDGPRSQWKVPDHLSMPHPKGGYMAMALMSRTMDDLDEVTGGTRAATYEEVDKYFGHALIAEGLVPFTYTADEAIRWWKAGGYQVLGGSTSAAPPHDSLAGTDFSSDTTNGVHDLALAEADNAARPGDMEISQSRRTDSQAPPLFDEMIARYDPNEADAPPIRPAVDFRIAPDANGISRKGPIAQPLAEGSSAQVDLLPVADRSLMSAPLYGTRPQLGWNPVRQGDEIEMPGPPAPPPLKKGDGQAAGPYASTTPTLHDRYQLGRAWSMAQHAETLGYKRAARNLVHYLESSGTPLEIDLRDMINTIPQLKVKQKENFDDVIVSGAKRYIKRNYRGEEGYFSVTGGWTAVQSDWNSDWYYTVGGFAIAHAAIVQYSPGLDGTVNVSIRPILYMFDRYNWDSGKGARVGRVVTVTDAQMGRLQEVGMAREYEMHGALELPAYRFSFDPSKYQEPRTRRPSQPVPQPPRQRARK